jgi:hypothetical protein
VEAVYLIPEAALVAVTSTPVTGPLLSRTVPRIEPVLVWAKSDPTGRDTRTIAAITHRHGP